MTENNTYQLIKNLAEREKLTEEEVTEMLTLAIQDVYHQKKLLSGELQITFDPEKKQFLVHRIYQIVDQINDPNREISAGDKLFQSKKNFCREGYLFQPLNLKKIVDYEEILQHFCSSLQKNRQKKWSEELLPLQGKVVEGTVQEVYHNYCLVNLLDREELGYWGKNEWLSYDAPLVGHSKRFLVKEVKVGDKNPIILARCNEDFLRKLLEIEVPEIVQGKIIVHSILRQPRVISKVIVRSKFPLKNPLGICIGKKGIRAQNIEKEMSPERIDLVEWKEDENEQLIKLFSPVEIVGFCKLQKKKDLIIIVRPEQFSLSLAFKGKIVKLVEDYLKVKVQIRTREEIDKENAVIIEMARNLKEEKANAKNYLT